MKLVEDGAIAVLVLQWHPPNLHIHLVESSFLHEREPVSGSCQVFLAALAGAGGAEFRPSG